jgi:hypothetical protein
MRRAGRLMKPVASKLPGAPGLVQHRPGTRCTYERHSQDNGLFILYFGRRYVVIPAVELTETVVTTSL